MPGLVGRIRNFRRGDRALDEEVKRALVETLYASTSSLIIGAIVGTAVAAIVASQARDPWVTLCAAGIGLVAATRVASALAYHHLLKAADQPGASRWERIYELGAWSYSALLGLLAWLVLARHDDPDLHLVTTATAIGYAAGICGRNSGRPSIAISQLALAALPAAIGLLMSPGLLYRTLGFATVAFVLAMIEITLQLHDVVRRAIVTTNEKQKAAETLQVALSAAEAANLTKSAFLTTMSHEIRTPLNGVLGMAQTLAAETLTASQRERVDTIQKSGETLLAILNDVLDLAKVEAGKCELEVAPLDLKAFLSTVHMGFEEVAKSKGLAFTAHIEPGAEGWYLGDALRLRQVANNLISNALKFTAQGSVTVRFHHDGDCLHLSVSDTGIGISEAHLEKIFERFSQADASTTRQFGGTGLGLSLCKELVGLMGGRIDVRSRPGEGAEFDVSLPLPRTQDQTPQEEDDSAQASPDSQRPARPVERPGSAAAHPLRRGQCGQPAGPEDASDPDRGGRPLRGGRRPGRGGVGGPRVRHHPDGHPDAGAGRGRGDEEDPPERAGACKAPHPDHRPHGQCHGAPDGGLSRRWDRRRGRQADQFLGADPGDPTPAGTAAGRRPAQCGGDRRVCALTSRCISFRSRS